MDYVEGLRMVDIQTVSIAIASAGVLVAAIYYVLETRHQNKMRQTELAMRLYQNFGTKEFMDSWWEIINREEKDYDEYV